MKVLVTSGGTKVPIDSVRSITNMSRGTFGSRIATVFYRNGHELHFMMAKGSRTPLSRGQYLHDVARGKIHEYEYVTYDDYASMLFEVIDTVKPDIIVLAAAVSDYGVVNEVSGKIRTTEDELTIRLKPLPKLISRVRDHAPDSVICGFKLLVGSDSEELERACINSLECNHLDLVVGNDLAEIRDDNHTLRIVCRGGMGIPVIDVHSKNSCLADPFYLARKVTDACEAKARIRNLGKSS